MTTKDPNGKDVIVNWIALGNKTYRHESGVEVKYDHNAWGWLIVGGLHNGETYKTLRVAQHYAA